MLIYFLLYIILGITGIICNNSLAISKKTNMIICVVGFLLITTMLALRHPSMGLDLRYLKSNGYLGSFDRIATIQWGNIWNYSIQNYEKGYIILNKIISTVKNDRQFFLGAIAVLSTLPVAACIYKKGVAPLQSFIIYLGLPAFLMSYSGLRQSLAIALCFFSISFIQDKKIIKFILTVLLAGTLHDSAFLFLTAYPIYYIKFSKNVRIGSIFSIALVYFCRHPLFTVLSKIVRDDVITDDNNAITLFIFFTLIYIFCVIYTNYDKEQNGLMNIFLIACFCQAFGGVYNLAMRVGYYFMMVLVLLLPLILRNIRIKTDKSIFITIVTICFAIFGLYSIYSSTWASAYPYIFFWENESHLEVSKVLFIS